MGRAGEGTCGVEDVSMLVGAFNLWILADNKRCRQAYKENDISSHLGILIYVGMSQYLSAPTGNPRTSFRNSVKILGAD